MTFTSRSKLAFLAALLAAACAAAAPAAHAAGPVFKIAHVVPQGDPRDVAARFVADRMKSSGTCPMEGQVFPAGQLGSTTDLIEGMQIGSVEAVVLPASFLVGFQPVMGIFDFPYFWPDDLQKLLALHGSDAVRKLLDTTDSQGVHSMAIWHTGYKQWTGNQALTKPADYQGKRARVMPSSMLVQGQKALGLTPVDMPFPETYNALQSGAISAQENPASTSFLMGLQEVQKFMTLTRHGTLDQVFMVSKAWYDGLSADCRGALDAAVQAGREVVAQETQKAEQKAMEGMRAAGVEIVTPSAEELAGLRQATLPKVREAFVAQTGGQGRALLEAVEAEMGR